MSNSARGSRIAPYLFILPAFVIFAAFMLYPLGRAVQFSFFEWDGLSQSVFVGTENYQRLFTDDRMRSSFVHAGVLIIFYSLIPLCVGTMLAAILDRARVKGIAFFRTVVFVPQVLAMVVVAVAWNKIYAPTGTINAVLSSVGLESWTRGWLGDYVFALPAIGLIGTWVQTGLVTVLMLAGMGRVPRELYESARLDGAGAIREFFSVTIPSVRGETAVALTMTIVAALKTFDLVYMTTSGGPGSSTSVPSFEVYYRAFETGEVGAATAIGVALTAMIFTINLIVNRIADKAEADK